MRLAALALWLCACSGGPGLVVEVTPVPLTAALIQPYLSVDGQQSQDIAPFAAIPGQAAQTFGLRLPSGLGTAAHLGVQVLDQNGCYLATGVADATVVDGEQITLPLTALPAPDCSSERPLLLSVIPGLAPTTGGAGIDLRGAGFLASDTVSFGSAQASQTWRSPMEIAAVAPPHTGIAQVPVAVAQPGGTTDQFATQFRYYTTALDFTSAAHSLSLNISGQTVPVGVAGFAFGQLAANQYPSLVGLVSTAGGVPTPAVVVVLNSAFSFMSQALPDVYKMPSQPLAAATGPLTSLGFVDIAVALQNSDRVLVLYNQGDGTYFSDAASMTIDDQSVTLITGGQPTQVVIADLNGDGKNDLVAADQTQFIDVDLRLADRLWASAQEYPVDLVPRDIAVGDLTGDGRPDVVVVYQGAENGVDVLVNQGDGTFPQGLYHQFLASATTLHQPVLADFDGDGHLDLAFAGESPPQVSVWLNVDGQFVSPVRMDYPLAMSPVALAVGDLDGDGLPDLAAVPTGSSSVAILLNQRSQPGTFQLYGMDFAIQPGSTALAILDADQDGANDIGVLGTSELVGLVNSSP